MVSYTMKSVDRVFNRLFNVSEVTFLEKGVTVEFSYVFFQCLANPFCPKTFTNKIGNVEMCWTTITEERKKINDQSVQYTVLFIEKGRI